MSGHWHCWCVCTLQQALNVYRRSLPLFFLLNSTSGCVSVCLNRQQQVCACVCTRVRVFVKDTSTNPKPESYRCSGVPNKLPQLTPHCHQCELEKRWICSIPQRCYFHTHTLHMLSWDQEADWEGKKKRQTGVKNLRELRNLARLPPCSHCLSV